MKSEPPVFLPPTFLPDLLHTFAKLIGDIAAEVPLWTWFLLLGILAWKYVASR